MTVMISKDVSITPKGVSVSPKGVSVSPGVDIILLHDQAARTEMQYDRPAVLDYKL